MEATANRSNAKSSESAAAAWLIVAAAAVRAGFGILMAIDAWLKWQPAFAAHYVGYLQNASNAQPHWLQPWFHFWLRLVVAHTGFFVAATRLIETAVAIGLLLGLARRITYIAGALFSLLIWSTAEGFGGPYTSGATNVGPALVYAFIFIAAALFEHLLGSNPYSLDYYIERVYPKWASLVAWTPTRTPQPRPALDWDHQLAAIGAIFVVLVFALSTLASSMTGLPPTPQNAAAAVSPLSIASGAPLTNVSSPVLPPLINNGNTAAVTMTASDATIQIASGVQYQAWTFNGTVPGPILHVRQGQTLKVTLVNNGTMQHSIDFHAAQVAPDVAYRSINQAKNSTFLRCRYSGAFIYHCGTPPVLQHMANGMYGAIIVDRPNRCRRRT
jgi:nitrite reductase (NO-forming)